MKWFWHRKKIQQAYKQRTYILPSRYGLLFGVAISILLLLAFGYANNLIFFVCFFLSSFAIVTMYMTNQNVKEVEIRNLSTASFFADEQGTLTVHLHSQNRQDLLNFRLECQSFDAWVDDVPRDLGSSAVLFLPKTKRGWHEVSGIKIESVFPYQLFRSWKNIRVTHRYLVFPAREGRATFPPQGNEGGQIKSQRQENQEEFIGTKPYEKSDSSRRIDWKSTARAQILQVRKFDSNQGENAIFRWQDTQSNLPIESRISQLALWIDIAERKNVNYQLVLPHWQSDLSHGSKHWTHCLEALATLDYSHVAT